MVTLEVDLAGVGIFAPDIDLCRGGAGWGGHLGIMLSEHRSTSPHLTITLAK